MRTHRIRSHFLVYVVACFAMLAFSASAQAAVTLTVPETSSTDGTYLVSADVPKYSDRRAEKFTFFRNDKQVASSSSRFLSEKDLSTGTYVYRVQVQFCFFGNGGPSYCQNESSNTKTVTVNRPIPNKPPVAVADSAATFRGVVLPLSTVSLLSNDKDPEGGALTIKSVVSAVNGSVNLSGSTVTFTPKAGYVGTSASFIYTVQDGKGATDTTKVSINVKNPDSNVTLSVSETTSTDGSYSVSATVPNYSDRKADKFTFFRNGKQVSSSTSHILSEKDLSTGMYNYHVVVQFCFNGNGLPSYCQNESSNTKTVMVNRPIPNKPPVAVADSAATFRGVVLPLSTVSLLSNDKDPEGGALTIKSVASAVNGSVNLSGSTVTFTPKAGYVGNGASFIYTVQDGKGATDTAKVSINVKNPDSNVTLTVSETTSTDGSYSVSATVPNYSDRKADKFTFFRNGKQVSSSTSHILSEKDLSTGTYNYHVVVQFCFNGNGLPSYCQNESSNTKTVTVNRPIPNKPPVAVADSAATFRGVVLPLSTASLLSNDKDPEGGALTIKSVVSAVNGSVNLSGSTVTFTPKAGYVGNGASFIYTVQDGKGATDTAKVSINVKNPDSNVTLTVSETTSSDGAYLVSADVPNYTDRKADKFTFFRNGISVQASTSQSLSENDLDTGTYNYHVVVQFCFTGNGLPSYCQNESSNTKTVTVNRPIPNKPPMAAADSATAFRGVALKLTTASLLSNDSDPEGGALTLKSVASAVNGSVSLSGNTVTFTPKVSYVGTGASFVYTVQDGKGATDTAKVSIEVKNPDSSVGLTVEESSSTDGSYRVSLQVPTYTDRKAEKVTFYRNNNVVQSGASQTLSENDLGTGSYTYRATVQFCFYISGSSLPTYCQDSHSNEATVTVDRNRKPVAVDDTQSALRNVTKSIAGSTLLANDSDADGDTLQLIGVGAASHGSVSLQGDLVRFAPEADYVGPASFTYSIRDGNGGTASATVAITVNQGGLLAKETIDVPPTPASTSASIVSAEQISVGDKLTTLAGAFRVDEGGAATYTMPLQLPDGTAGVTPQVALSYSSHAGNGIAGKGWSLNGVRAIARCRQTAFQDRNPLPITWSEQDRFCLDGARLVLDGGTYGHPGSTYKTEIDSYVLVKAVGGTAGHPDYFELKAKDGSVSLLGSKGNHHADIAPYVGTVKQHNKVISWNLSEFRDSVGNKITYHYNDAADNQTLARIEYAYGNSSTFNAQLRFHYKEFSDASTGYIAGYALRSAQRLTSVEVFNRVEGSLREVRSYHLNYLPVSLSSHSKNDLISRLESISMCANGVCESEVKTEFQWGHFGSSVYGTTSRADSYLLPGTFSPSVSVITYQVADIDGDGQQDIIYQTAQYRGENDYSIHLSYRTTDNGSGSIFNASHDVSRIDANTLPKLHTFDYNGDGRSDLFYNGRIYLAELDIDGKWRLQNYVEDAHISDHKNTVFTDINGDGLTDHVRLVGWQAKVSLLAPRAGAKDSSAQPYAFSAPLSYDLVGAEDGWQASPKGWVLGDFNGDGQADLGVKVRKFDRILDTTCPDGSACKRYGYDDILALFVKDPVTQQYTLFDSRISHFKKGYGLLENIPVGFKDLTALDINGDGLSDISYRFSSSRQYYALSNGLQLLPASAPVTTELQHAERGHWLDYNEDGFMDYVWFDVSKRALRYVPWNSRLEAFPLSKHLVSVPKRRGIYFSYYDANGDGHVDIAQLTPEDGRLYFRYHKGDTNAETGNFNDRIRRITNSVGNTTKIHYGPLNQSGHYLSIKGATGSVQPRDNVCYTSTDSGGTTHTHCLDDVLLYTQDVDSFYRMMNRPFADLPEGHRSLQTDKHAPVLEAAGSAHVVTEVFSSSPHKADANATRGVAYFYEQLRLQASGRGGLGFKHLRTIDLQTQVETRTTYRQDWPFIGHAIETVKKTDDGHILARSISTPWLQGYSDDTYTDRAETLRTQGSSALGSVQVYTKDNVDYAYDLASNGTAQGGVISTTVNTLLPDTYGNPKTSTTSVYAGEGTAALFSRVTTTNLYASANDGEFLGRLSRSTVKTERPSAASASKSTTRVAEFDYYGSGAEPCASAADALTGLLCQERILDGNITKLSTTHYYDAFGNEAFQYAVDDQGQSRLSPLNQYDPDGRHVDKVYGIFNALAVDFATAEVPASYANLAQTLKQSVRLTSEVQSRNQSNAPITTLSYLDDQSSAASTVAYSPYGAPYFRRSDSGDYSITLNSSNVQGCPAGAVFSSEKRMAGGGHSRECFDVLGRSVRTLVKSFVGDGQSPNAGDWVYSDTEYDALGRAYRSSQPYFAGEGASAWTEVTDFDLLDRPLRTVHPSDDGTKVSTIAYDGLRVITTNPAGQSNTEVTNLAGEIVQVTNHQQNSATYGYDPLGHLVRLADPAGNTTTISYNLLGQKTAMNDPDKGAWTYAYSSFGDLLCQRNANGNVIRQTYDASGRMLARRDYASGSCASPGKLLNTANWDYDTAPHGIGQLDSEQDSSGYYKSYDYDALGRGTQVTTHIPGDTSLAATTHSSRVTYDQFGRPFQSYDAAREGDNFERGAIQNVYDVNGYLWQVANAHREQGQFAEIYHTVAAMDARGNVTSSKLADGVIDRNLEYDAYTGLMDRIVASSAGGLNVLQDLTMTWDNINNLTSRHDRGHNHQGKRRNLLESFDYDQINQLTDYDVSGDITHRTEVRYSSDGIGNIDYKSDVGHYDYSGRGPHAVSRAGGVSYTYDNNGNMLSGDGRSMVYSVFDKVTRITKGSHVTEFHYGTDRSRYKRSDTKGTDRTTTLYLGSVEKVYQHDNTVTWKRNIAGVAQITLNFNSSGFQDKQTHYLLKDHLGSISAIADDSGQITQLLAFDPWGARRNTDTWQELEDKAMSASFFIVNKPLTTRGFTGHEMLDDVGIIHMNGRIYDAKLARFMQADPIVQEPFTIGSLNRYSYTMNNPLNAVDPSGFSFLSDAWKSIRPYIGVIIGIVVAIWCQVCGASIINAAWTAGTIAATSAVINGADGRTMFRAFLGGFVSGAAFGAIGQYFRNASSANFAAQHMGEAVKTYSFGGLNLTSGQIAGQISSHAVAGGVIAELQGGKFGHGFISAGVTKGVGGAFLPGGANLDAGEIAYGTAVSGAIGGITSELTGGKFRNGATTAAAQYLFNQAGKELKKSIDNVDPTLDLIKEKMSSYSKQDLKKMEVGVLVYRDDKGALQALSIEGENKSVDMSPLYSDARKLGVTEFVAEFHSHPTSGGGGSYTMSPDDVRIANAYATGYKKSSPNYRAFFSDPKGRIYEWDPNISNTRKARSSREKVGSLWE